jgi:Carboxypeptidase regulatory-like domain
MTLDHGCGGFSSGFSSAFNVASIGSLFICSNRFLLCHSRMSKRSYSPALRVRRFAFLKRAARSLLLAFLLALLLISSLVAQVSTTSLRGVVSDPGGAVLTAAQITLTNCVAGFSRTTTSNERRDYQLLQVPPGTYAVTAAATGFATVRKESVVLLVNTPATLDSVLKVGNAETTVDVRGEAPAVNTLDATLGNAFDSKQIASLPSEGWNAVELLSLHAGVTYVGNQVNTGADPRDRAVNGAGSDQTNVTVDGLDDNDQLLGQHLPARCAFRWTRWRNSESP